MKRSAILLYLLLGLTFLSSCDEQKPFTLVLLPDTQIYSLKYPDIFYTQTEWIAGRADSIAFVLHQGDITHNNTEKEWQAAARAMQLLDGKVPYTFVPGNHDMGTKGSADVRDTGRMNTYFPYDTYSSRESFGGAFEPGRMDNTWHRFRAGGYDWLILSLEFGPRNEVLDWAGSVIEAHPDHNVIINTHAYMYSDETRMSAERGHYWLPQAYGVGKATGAEAVNSGQEMWEKLVSQYPNILMVVSGHVLNDGVGTLISEGVNGNKVYQMLANYQGGVEGSQNGGNGFLRMLTFDPAASRIEVQTYSPYTEEYKTEPHQHFAFENVEFD